MDFVILIKPHPHNIFKLFVLYLAPAHVPDIDQTAKIHRALETKSLLPHEHFVDAGYVDTDLLVSSLAEHKIQLIGPVRPDPSWQAKVPEAYDSSRFDIDWNKKGDLPRRKS